MKILIVEDKASELALALKTAIEMGFEVVTAINASVGSKMVCKDHYDPKTGETTFEPLVDGVVTDIFMPYFEEGQGHDNSDSPCGVLVAAAAIAAKIPVAFCTGGYHHGLKFQWIQTMSRYLPVGMVDTGSREEMDAPKDWKKAFEGLRVWIERKKV